jgi:hypothetical protein
MSSEIIQSLVYDNIYDHFFNMSASYFHKISFHYFEDYLMTKLTLGVRCIKKPPYLEKILPSIVSGEGGRGRCLLHWAFCIWKPLEEGFS